MKIFKMCLICFVGFFIPVFGQKVEPGPAFAVKISEEAVKLIESQNEIITDTVLVNRVVPIARKIMRASDLRTIFDCRILNTDVVNAFALPAGPIYVTLGMLNFLDSLKTEESQSMLAGILGHEIAHVFLRHSVAWQRLKNFMDEERAAIPSEIVQILEKGYSRQQEFEADEYGILYAMRAGYDFESIIKFYKAIRENYGETPPGDEIYDDHPRLTERIAHLYEMRAQLERNFDQFNFGVEALNEGRYSEAVTYFKLFTATFSNSAAGWMNLGAAYLFEAVSKLDGPPVIFVVTYHEKPNIKLRGIPDELLYAEEAYKKAAEVDSSYNAVYYGNQGIIFALSGDYDRAEEFTRKALEGEEAEHFFYNNLGNIFYLKGEYKDAEAAYKKAVELAEDWALPVYNTALLYEKAGQKKLAIDTWKKLLDVSGFSKEAVEHLVSLDKTFKYDLSEVGPECSLGGIYIGMPEDSVRSILGEPDEQVALEKLFALSYYNHNIVVFLREKEVSGVLAQNGFSGKTSKGIGIGSPASEVRAAYGLPDDIVQQKDQEQWIYKKLGFLANLCGKKVNSLQIVKVGE
ncbi:MAG TPA: tetratricopeptide repeat protein [candidate division WOR-3 bacterium]|uniref:Tetratricopeptide repeat protein n=1 Tax=candidate division WOR-3 bacterium TaxID=2052148 RepID=A0A9C9EPT4_UNCW3|nr:tetratricopeptide repeat protein [candidate division WOR-3 bacterium]